MRCLSCHRLSLSTFCKRCKDTILKPNIIKRELNSFDVYSFFNYKDIEDFLHTKHTPQGFIVYRALAKMVFRPFIREFIENCDGLIYIIGVDEVVYSGYSHVALLTHEMRTGGVKVLHSRLIAQNRDKYAGKSLKFRVENPRGFIYSGEKNIEAILVDDIITTGTTLKEAKRVLEENGVTILFGLTLASVV